MIIDPSTNLGKLRLRVADFGDLPMLPDEVYTQTLADTKNNLPAATLILSKYILGMLSHKTHRKLNQLEIWGSEAFNNYKEFLLMTIKNPAFMDISFIPYSSTDTSINPLIQFKNDWNKNYANGTQSQQLAFDGLISPNDGSLYGNRLKGY